MFNLLEIYLHL